MSFEWVCPKATLATSKEEETQFLQRQKTRKAQRKDKVSASCLNVCADQLVLISTQILPTGLLSCMKFSPALKAPSPQENIHHRT